MVTVLKKNLWICVKASIVISEIAARTVMEQKMLSEIEVYMAKFYEDKPLKNLQLLPEWLIPIHVYYTHLTLPTTPYG